MFAAIPVISPAFQFLLNAIGWALATIYRFIPNYGIAIIILTLLIRFLLLPLGIKQIKSMQHMQAIQPKIKDLQKKYKGNKQKVQEETMKLYKEAGVNPLGGCLPLLLQFPILISMYAVIRMPLLEAVPNESTQPAAYVVKNNHLPVDSRLFADVIEHTNTGVLIVNLQCSAVQAGTQALLNDTAKNPVQSGKPLVDGATNAALPESLRSSSTLNCGTGGAAKIPYYFLLLFMVVTTFYQQRQMQKASPPGSASQQQQAILKLMPIMFGVFGFTFPAGLVVYWTVSNLFQIGQQALLLRAGHIGPEALERRMAEQRAKNVARGGAPVKKGFVARMMEAQQAADPKQTQGGKQTPKADGRGAQPPSKPSGPRRKPNTGGNRGGGAGPKKRPGGGRDGSSG